MILYVILVLATVVLGGFLIHRDGIAIGREQALADRERRIRNLSRHSSFEIR